MTWVEPLNLQYWLVNTLAESLDIFIFVAFIVLAMMSAKFRMPNYVFMSMLTLLIVILNYFYEGLGGIYLLAIFLIGLFTYFSLAKFWE